MAADKFAWLALETPKSSSESFDSDDARILPESSAQYLEKGYLNINKPVPQPPPDALDTSVTKVGGRTSFEHFATSQELNRPIMTCDGFKRHEKEQERYWVFLPFGPVETSPQGSRCALCPTPHPDEEHLRFHNTLQHSSGSKPQIKKSRKGDFEKLLNAHKVHDQYISDLVERWRFVRRKKAYSCGFCVNLFDTLSERTKHLCHAHFHRGQKMDHWHTTNLIRGLLLQPEVNKEYRNLYGVDPSSVESHRIWIVSKLKNLQNRLEISEESPRDLAIATHNAARYLDSPSRRVEFWKASSHFSRRPQNFSTSPNVANQETKRPMSTSIPSIVNLTTSTTKGREASNIHAQHAKGVDMPLSSPYAAQCSVRSATNLPVRSDSLSFCPTRGPQAASYQTGNSCGTQLRHVGWEPSLAASGSSAQNINSENIGPCETISNPGSLISDEAQDHYELNTSDVIDEYMHDSVHELEETTQRDLENFSVPKRKLSEDSAAVANSKAQTVAPRDLLYEFEDTSMWI